MRIGLPLMKNVLTPSAKSVLIPSGLILAASATDAAIQKKIHGSGMTTLIISNKEMKDILKTVKFLEKSSLLIKGVSGTIQNEAKEQKDRFLSMLLGTLAVCLLGAVVVTKAKIPGWKVIFTNFVIKNILSKRT